MAQFPQAHHTLRVRNVAAMRALFSTLGFHDAEDGTLQHPETGQVVTLQPDPGAATAALREGDVSIGIPVGAVDLEERLGALRQSAPGLSFDEPEPLPKDDAIAVRVDGLRLILTRKREPFYVIHYSAAGWEAAAPFYEQALGFCFFPLPNRGEVVRTRFENAGGRVDIEVSPAVSPDPAAARFRLVTGKMGQAVENVEPGGWAEPLNAGAGIVLGPNGELIELLDRTAGGA